MTTIPGPNPRKDLPGPRSPFLFETWAYRARVPILLGFFAVAMVENSRHPFPLWAEILRTVDGGTRDISGGMRHMALLAPLALYGIALLVRLSATATLGSGTVWGFTPRTANLVEEGLFSCVRHPLYAGSGGMILSLSLMSSAQGAAILVGGGIPFLAFLARHEEKELLRALPGYADYRRRVPPFFPSFGRGCRFSASFFIPLRRNLGRAIRSEAVNVGLLGGFLAFWALPGILLFWIAFLLATSLALTAPIWIPEQPKGSL